MTINAQGYAGDVRPREAYENIMKGAGILVDVRTQAEWSYVGVPDLSSLNQQVAFVQWLFYPTNEVNKDFVSKVVDIVGDKKETPIYFLCRSGQRSQAAAIALTNAGYSAAFNVLNGFEGGIDDKGHRGKIAGWKAVGLPWKQG